MADILNVKDLNVKFDRHTIIDNLSFDVKRDATLAVIGPNGAGKTVLFKTLLGLIPYAGEIVWAKDARIGYVPQKLSIGKDIPITVKEFLQLKEPKVDRVRGIMKQVGFKEKAQHLHHDMRVLNTRVGNLSGGELQRILMVYALLGDPNVLLLDEPTAGVDIEGEETFYNLFERLKKDADLTIIFISHDMEVVKTYSDEILELKHHGHELPHFHNGAHQHEY